jgi:hypothetical protein
MPRPLPIVWYEDASEIVRVNSPDRLTRVAELIEAYEASNGEMTLDEFDAALQAILKSKN